MVLTYHTDKDEDDDLEGNLRFRAFFRSVFVTKKNSGFSDLVTIAFSVLSRSLFSAKIKSGFRICFSMQFDVFPVFRRKSCTAMDINCVLVLSNFACHLQF